LAQYAAGQTFMVQYSRQRVSQLPTVDFTIPYDGTWVILLDNKYSVFASKSVATFMSVDNGSTSGNDSTLIVYGVCGMFIIGAMVAAIYEYQKKKALSANNVDV
jgi:hypothetical protein